MSIEIPDSIYQLRQILHQQPEPSGFEVNTSLRIVDFFRSIKPDRILQRMGGNGVAIEFGDRCSGNTLMFRCELDALRISERNSFSHRSIVPGVSHKCGHDGHMAILAALGHWLSRNRPEKCRVVLLYQPAEENGQGAQAVLDDPEFEQIRPNIAFAMHNLPGFEFGQVITRSGVFACASRGMSIALHGATAHAAQPNTGHSPVSAANRIIEEFAATIDPLSRNGELPMITIVGVEIGKKDFGVAPADGRIWATLRSETNASMIDLVKNAESIVRKNAVNTSRCYGENVLAVNIDYEDIFEATINSASAVETIRSAACGLNITEIDEPFRWSEDFGRFSNVCETAMFGLGAGVATPALHDANYDFPDALIPIATKVFANIVSMYEAEPNSNDPKAN